MLCYDLQQRLPEKLKKKTRTENHNLPNSDKVLQIDIELPDFDMNNTDPVIEEFFDTRTFEEQNAIEKGSSSQENTNINKDWSINNIFQL
ncbi:28646_t:CDS:2 [Gigaspora margarita]|uniref:28646_t:CDS:1 n=1 Tax=Gigaspora margarita TaxID=4874 RepID=A0ABN7UJH6_GIGMA|nr:28646_t:CDS:2 [Gigaspora margarita]